jgi:Fe-S-cluster-containing dehydrogenase component
MSRWHLVVDVERCEDCNNCTLACKDEHVDNDWPGYAAPQPRHGQRWIDILRKERGGYPLVQVSYLPLPCQHCDAAPCIVAGGGAVHKREDGIVLIDPTLARGRREIVASCPYGAIYWNEAEALPQKCTLCAHLLDNGWTTTRCVQACPTGALTLVHAEDADFAGTAAREGLQVLTPEAGTQPTTHYRHLARYFSRRLAGSVTIERDGMVDCAKGAQAILTRDGSATTAGAGDAGNAGSAPGEPVAQARTDAFGDYVFDGLPTDDADYTVTVTLDDYQPATTTAHVIDSTTLPTIALTPRSA